MMNKPMDDKEAVSLIIEHYPEFKGYNFTNKGWKYYKGSWMRLHIRIMTDGYWVRFGYDDALRIVAYKIEKKTAYEAKKLRRDK